MGLLYSNFTDSTQRVTAMYTTSWLAKQKPSVIALARAAF